jgi:hypothetical protein
MGDWVNLREALDVLKMRISNNYDPTDVQPVA